MEVYGLFLLVLLHSTFSRAVPTQNMEVFGLFLLVLLQCSSLVTSFQVPKASPLSGSSASVTRLAASATDTTNSEKATTLTEATTWKMRLVLNDRIPRQSNNEIYSVNGFFQEEEGYEPPQGSFNGKADTDTSLEVTKSRWMLSEDPEDRKDSLWIWGLFSEPLYPFLLLQISLTEKDADGNARTWPPLYAQISHRRKDGSVFLEPADLKVRNLEQLNADPFGAAKVEIYEEDVVGRISFQPISSS